MANYYSLLELPDLLSLWDRAIQSPRGIKIKSSNASNLLQKMAAVRRETNSKDMRRYALCRRDDWLWIVPHEEIVSRVELMREGRGL